jgi:hypothetical protein
VADQEVFWDKIKQTDSASFCSKIGFGQLDNHGGSQEKRAILYAKKGDRGNGKTKSQSDHVWVQALGLTPFVMNLVFQKAESLLPKHEFLVFEPQGKQVIIGDGDGKQLDMIQMRLCQRKCGSKPMITATVWSLLHCYLMSIEWDGNKRRRIRKYKEVDGCSQCSRFFMPIFRLQPIGEVIEIPFEGACNNLK